MEEAYHFVSSASGAVGHGGGATRVELAERAVCWVVSLRVTLSESYIFHSNSNKNNYALKV